MWRGLGVGVVALAMGFAAEAEPVTKVAFLGVQFLNDHQDDEPTTAAERVRLAAVATAFRDKLEASGLYAFVALPATTQARIDSGPVIGNCGGCEFGYGADAGSDRVAWIVVQKVSDLIINLNVYVGDVAGRKLTFVHSVDIRGNTDESWAHGMTYLVKNYVLKEPL